MDCGGPCGHGGSWFGEWHRLYHQRVWVPCGAHYVYYHHYRYQHYYYYEYYNAIALIIIMFIIIIIVIMDWGNQRGSR